MYSKSVKDRMSLIGKYVSTGDVLDLGCVDARPSREDSKSRLDRKPDVLFRCITNVNPGTLGIDIDEEGVRVLQELGYNVQCADVETMDLGRQFDAIVAGEIIEHLENPGVFLRNLKLHLKPGGTLIVSTPNPFYTGQTWKIWRYGSPQVHEDHMGWQDPTTLNQLLVRTGFDPVDGCWIQPHSKLFKTWKRLFRPYFAHSFLIVAKHAQAPTSRAA